ncbi:MAG: rhomboid family intramembrane serine protease [Rhodothermales bacterium]|nr:rhomboid family intramembrane serine protease [Rhodothermales bacterium]
MNFDFSDAPVTLLLLLINVLVSGYALYSDASLIERLGFQPVRIRERGEYYRFITAGFVHAGVAHLAFNMITLYFFGPLLEQILGAVGFLALYFGSELAAHALTFWHQRDNDFYNAVGASGAISGVVFAFCMFFPFEMLYLFFALPIPAIVFAFGYVFGSIYAMKRAREQGQVGGIAHEAHLGGALGGVVLTLLLEPRVIDIFLGHLGF